jgi:sugar transferase (PEP-CTERM/EpsH1 system associated)
MRSVCQLVHSLNVGGAEILADRFARQLQHRARMVFACLDDLGPLGEQLVRENTRVEQLHRRPGFDLRCAWRLGRFLKQEKVALVHAHQYTPYFYATLARMMRGGPPILFTEHGRFFPDLPNRKRMLVNPRLLRRDDRIVAVGECVRQALIHNEGFPAERIEVIYNGVDLQRFEKVGHRETTRQAIGCSNDDFLCIFVARLDPIKDHRTAILAIREVVKQRPNVRLLVVGDGPQRGVLEELIRKEGLAASVRMLGTRRDIPELLSAADLFLLTSVSEGIPLTIIEAMGIGLPVVATNVGGIGEVVIDQATGFFFPAGDYHGMAAAVRRLAEDPDLCRRMGAAGRERAVRCFSERTMIEKYDAVYQAMLGDPSR